MADEFDNPDFVNFYTFAMEQARAGDKSWFEFIAKLKQPPVSIEHFLDDEEFMKHTDLTLWPVVRETIVALNHEWWRGKANGAMTELLAMGATGTGKSEIAKVSMAYHLHILGCMMKPQTYWAMPTATQILIPIFAAKPKVTKQVLYMPLRAYVEQMPWFRKHMRFDPYIESEMFFKENNIRVVPVGADVDAILGEAIPGGIIDEINFMQVVENSKKAEAKTGRASKYDQAEDIFNKLTRRKTSRFTRSGPNVGVICSLSSTSHPGEFTEKRLEEVRRDELTNVLVFDKAQYEARPSDNYSGATFHCVIHGNAAKTIELLDDGEKLPKEADIFDVPIELKPDFQRDPEGSVRDIIGKSVRAVNPFITRRSALTEAVDLWHQVNPPYIVDEPNVYSYFGLPIVQPEDYCRNPQYPRYVHIDLAHTGDRCGVAMVRYDGLATMERRSGLVERLPTGVVELAMSIEPDTENGIDIAEVRTWVGRLRTDLGYPIRVVSYDGWNSLESRQQWKKQGMKTVLTSVDKTTGPYKELRDALYDGRLALYPNEVLIDELQELEHNTAHSHDKIDHPPNGSKDIADAVCGAYYVMLNRASTWRSDNIDKPGVFAADRYGSERAELGDRF
jgi:hypothetical protein